MSKAFSRCLCIFLPCALSLLYSPFLLYCCVLLATGWHISVGILERTSIHSTNTSADALFIKTKTKPSPNPVTTLYFYTVLDAWLMHGSCLPMCLQDSIVGLDARHFSSQKYLKFSLTVEHISHQCIIASLCIFAWILLNVILLVRKLLECRAVAVLASFFFSVLMRDWIYYSNKITGSLLTSFPTGSALYSVA